MNYNDLVYSSHQLLDHQYQHWWFLLYDEWFTSPTNISIIAQIDWEFRENIRWFQLTLSDVLGNHFIYPTEKIHSTIAYFPFDSIDLDNLMKILQVELKKHEIEYKHHWFLPSPRGEWIVWILEPNNWWRYKIVSIIEQYFDIEQWKKMNNPIIYALLQQYARSYVLKFKQNPNLVELEYIKSLAHISLWLWRPKEICIYKTNSPLLTNAELLWTIVL